MIHAGCNYRHYEMTVYVVGVNLEFNSATIQTPFGEDTVNFIDLKPIPITPELMLKLGFTEAGTTKSGARVFRHSALGSACYIESDQMIIFEGLAEAKNLHQVQMILMSQGVFENILKF